MNRCQIAYRSRSGRAEPGHRHGFKAILTLTRGTFIIASLGKFCATFFRYLSIFFFAVLKVFAKLLAKVTVGTAPAARSFRYLFDLCQCALQVVDLKQASLLSPLCDNDKFGFRGLLMKRCVLILLLCITTVAQNSSTPAAASFDGKSWWNYVKVLADDNMEGRETGSAGLRKAAAYIVEQLKNDGLEPAGSNGYYQPVKLISRQIDESGSSLALVRNGTTEPLTLGEDAMFSTRVDLAPEVDAPLVFVGYGLSVPEKKYSDFTGLDLKGRVAVVISGSPSDMPAALASHYQSMAERAQALRAAGAVGLISIPNPASMDIPWGRMTLARTRPSMTLADPSMNESAGIRLAVVFNPADAEKLFQGSGHSFEEIAALAKDRKPITGFALTASIKAHAKVIVKEVDSDNVVAKLPGTDPKLKTQYVVLSAHMDHLGIGEPINGDRIYNGAMDNGSGSALVLDIANSLHRSQTKLKRSVLFVFVTGEEKGLLGSRYFANQPTVPKDSIVADINTDMFLPIFPLKILTVYGLDESTLGGMARKVAQEQGVQVQADPQPLRNAFIRSDQYSFIRQGIPSVAMKVGFAPGSAEEVAEKKWLTERYHAPSDDLDQPVDLAAAGKFEDIVQALAIKAANDPQRPQWNGDSFFSRFVVAPMTGQ
jgi:Zn-dependent M28 family amino/carboxypeptidase